MSPELDDKLCADFPLLFRERHGDPLHTCMHYGFPEDGWYELIREASTHLERMIERWYEEHAGDERALANPPCASQVKEKFGTLRIYMHNVPDDMRGAIRDLYISYLERSRKICMCGAPRDELTFRCEHR